jgi:hypothetical protein
MCKTPFQWKKAGCGGGMCLSSSSGGKYKIRGLRSRPTWAKSKNPHLQNNQGKMGWGHGSYNRVLPSKCEVLSSNPSPGERERERERERENIDNLDLLYFLHYVRE